MTGFGHAVPGELFIAGGIDDSGILTSISAWHRRPIPPGNSDDWSRHIPGAREPRLDSFRRYELGIVIVDTRPPIAATQRGSLNAIGRSLVGDSSLAPRRQTSCTRHSVPGLHR